MFHYHQTRSSCCHLVLSNTLQILSTQILWTSINCPTKPRIHVSCRREMEEGWNLRSTCMYYLEQELKRLLLGFKIWFSRWLIILNENFDWNDQSVQQFEYCNSFISRIYQITRMWIGFQKQLHVPLLWNQSGHFKSPTLVLIRHGFSYLLF